MKYARGTLKSLISRLYLYSKLMRYDTVWYAPQHENIELFCERELWYAVGTNPISLFSTQNLNAPNIATFMSAQFAYLRYAKFFLAKVEHFFVWSKVKRSTDKYIYFPSNNFGKTYKEIDGTFHQYMYQLERFSRPKTQAMAFKIF